MKGSKLSQFIGKRKFWYVSVTEKYLNLATVFNDLVKIMILSCSLMANHEYLLLFNKAFDSIQPFC